MLCTIVTKNLVHKVLNTTFFSDLISVNNNLLFKLFHNYKNLEVQIVFLYAG